MRNVTAIVTKLKLAQILRKMMTANMDMRSIDAAIQLRPEAFNGVDARTALGRILTATVVHLDVAIARLVNILIPTKFIGADSRTKSNMLDNDFLHRLFGAADSNSRDQFTATFDHADNASLVALVARAFAGDRTANKRFVNLDNLTGPAKGTITVNNSHILADFMTHAPCGLVGNTDLAFDFLGRNTMPRRAEHEHDIEPVPQAGARPVKGRVGGWIDLMAAIFASVGATFFHAVEMGRLAALRAIMAITKANTHKMLKTAIFRRELVLKLAESEGFRFHKPLYSINPYLSQGDNCQTSSG